MTTNRTLRSALALLVLAMPPGARAQEQVGSELETAFAEAEALFFSADQAESMDLFGAIIERARVERVGGAPELEGLYLRALAYRAEAAFNLGDDGVAETDLREMLRARANADVDRELASPNFVRLFERLRAETVGELTATVSPSDATLLVDGTPIDWGTGPIPLSAGPHAVTVERLGFAPYQAETNVVAGESNQLDVRLERATAVITFALEPGDAEVRIDGQPVSLLTPLPQAAAAVRGANPRSVQGLLPGEHRIRVSREMHRTLERSFTVAALSDYSLGVLRLEPAVGTILLRGIPDDAEVRMDEAPVTVERRAGRATLEVAPGTYALLVNAGALGVFAADVEVYDAAETVLDVVPRPTLAYLGALGGDRVGADSLTAAMESAAGAGGRWLLRNRPERTGPVLARLGLTAEALRGPASAVRGRLSGVYSELAEAVGASAYVLGVLNDDLVATQVDVWLWAGPPAPAALQVLTLDLASTDLPRALASLVALDLRRERTHFGALAVDADGAAGPVIFSVDAEGPAAAAGLQVGDVVKSVDGNPVRRAADLAQRLAAGGAGSSNDLVVARGAAEITLPLQIETSLGTLVPGIEGLPYGLVWPLAEAERRRNDGSTPVWVLEMHQAAVLLHTGNWQDAVRLLRTIDAPSRAGVGKGTVEYWVGLALLQLGPDYREQARAALRRALAIEGARIGHDDGPPVAPRARAFLALLGE